MIGLRHMTLVIVVMLMSLASGCFDEGKDAAKQSAADSSEKLVPVRWEADEQPSRVYYEIFVRSFYDTNGDGIGDLNGVTEKLDYLQELGVEGIWLMPITASPSYHGYDVTDYYAVNPDYGTLEDLRNLVAEAHKRDILVIADLVVNHTSSEHPWFKEAIESKDSPYRDWYTIKAAEETVPSDNAAGNGSPWHPHGSSKYLGIFWEGMPDLNFANEEVRQQFVEIGKFWLSQGLDGFRLDAAKHIFGDFSSSQYSEAVVADNQRWWQQFRSGLDEVNDGAYLVGEIWDSPTVVAPYLSNAFDSGFNFDLGERIIAAARDERGADIAFTLKRIYSVFEKASNGQFVDAIFLTNHDQNRVMSLLGNNKQHAAMAASILLTLPGNPFLYYGEEIGMRGMKPDESIREPMPWMEANDQAAGQTTWEEQRYNRDGGESVEAMKHEQDSLLNHYRMLLQWRKEEQALRNGSIDEFTIDNEKVGAYIRMDSRSRVLVVHNMSGSEQAVELPSSDKYGAFDRIRFASQPDKTALHNGKLSLPPYSTAVLK
ncbi:alpha-amylase family glycosyl hydrolase [Paenibacillus sp. HB172176]|uniref:alpha-amylase family glycosyl hydrolase n=1 Tax=Paenibacillus sp. HB172176 TaxID=2493690 RepID=UPI00143996EE|nr:alpha-amylase family glycosyl hydrolase [Paenibacillus sp. HB172176]